MMKLSTLILGISMLFSTTNASPQVVSTYTQDFSSYTSVTSDFEAYQVYTLGGKSEYDTIYDGYSESARWYIEDGKLNRRSLQNEINVDNGTNSIGIVTYTKQKYTNFELTVDYKMGLSTYYWPVVAFRQTEVGQYHLADGAGAFVQNGGKALTGAKEALSDIKNNINFMDQVNQFYSFVQIPLKLNSQLQNSELYVYQNKRKGGNSEDEELSAFLHFDLPALGSTDISVKLLKKNVTCNWYLENEKSMELIEQNIDRLEAKLNALGYNCNFGFESENKKFSFEDDFLRARIDTAAPKALVHRYSFDVRA